MVAWRSNGRLAHGGITTCSSSLGFVSVEPALRWHRIDLSACSFPAGRIVPTTPAAAATTREKGRGGGCDV